MRGRSGRRPRVARECHSAGGPSSKAVSCSRDRGCNGHRILRRVPNDRRHPSPKRGVGFHETAQSVGLAISASSDPLQPVKTRASGEDKETGNVGEARRSAEDVTRGRDRGVRGSAACAPWEENAHARSPAREGLELEVSTQGRSAEAVSDVVKHPVPRSCRTEPYTPWDVHAGQPAERVGNMRGAGARSSFEWQKSVRRVARLLHRSIARSDGG